MDIFIHLMASFGLMLVVQNKIPFLHGKAEFLDRLMACPLCLGFWTGWAVWLCSHEILGIPILVSDTPFRFLGGVVWSFASAGFCFILSGIADALEHYFTGVR